METDDLDALELQIDQLLKRYHAMRSDCIKQQREQAVLQHETAALQEKNKQVKTKVEAIITRLKGVEKTNA